MEKIYDTEIGEVEEIISPDNIQGTPSHDKGEDFLEKSVDSATNPVHVEDTESTEEVEFSKEVAPAQVAGETIIVPTSNAPKTFEQSGYEVSVVFCLAVIIGLMIWESLSKRWHT